ncbi:MFS transporter [Falsirhodobacter sp. 20TX0035]|uniref:MFS transporter n=1 Tax=Falsirhodobacter sp. 20TX0035 TaxID=3022019 RepID=UPI00232B8191|nr:aromatic acid/H+ symport family MFS transporter [Falsirhodobacter sp. 20TX0035]MDB6453020.1 aromatic acid/H+ symport family MFS transporter [Falsirhodobacter sp. 20TX0035]
MTSASATIERDGARAGWVVTLCWIAVVLDGFDLVVLGALIPTLTGSAAPFMTGGEATFIATIGLVGMMIGALSIGAATDRFGRRQALIWTVAAFSLLSALCGMAQTPTQLAVLRFLAGIGLGGCLPTAIAMVTEFSRGRAGRASTTVMTGYHVGAVSTALLALLLLPVAGWRAMFVAGALPGLILVPLMLRHLAESPAYLLAQGRRAEAERIARAHGIVLTGPEAGAAKASTRTLFEAGRLKTTLAIWVTSFMGLLLVYGLNSWLPALMVAADYGLERGLWLLLLLNLGAICGLVVAGQVGDRIGLKRAAVIWFAAGAVLLAFLSWKMPVGLLYPAVFLTGCFVFSAQVLVYAYTAAHHPAGVRATAIGMSAGVGRLGAIAGPLIGGTLVSMGLGHPWGFYIFALVGVVATLAMGLTAGRAR